MDDPLPSLARLALSPPNPTPTPTPHIPSDANLSSVTPASPSPPGPKLPSDLLIDIIHLSDRPTLFVLLRVNNFFYDQAIRLIYRDLQPHDPIRHPLHLLPSRMPSKNAVLANIQYLTLGEQNDWSSLQENYITDWDWNVRKSAGSAHAGECTDGGEEDALGCRYNRCPDRPPSSEERERKKRGLDGQLDRSFPSPSSSIIDCACLDTRLHVDQRIPVLPNLQTLRLSPSGGNVICCIEQSPCDFCDFFCRLTPKTWVIKHTYLPTIRPIDHIHSSLRTVVLRLYFEFNHNGHCDWEDGWTGVWIENFVATFPPHIHLILIYGFDVTDRHPPWLSVDDELDDLAQICARSANRITVASPISSRTPEVWLPDHDPRIIRGDVFQLKDVLERTKTCMASKGSSRKEISARLAKIRFVNIRELEKEDWVPVMGSRDSSDWLDCN